MQERLDPSKQLELSYRHYEQVYEESSRHKEMTDESEIDFFSELVPKDRRYRVLDLGCAEGKLAIRLAKSGHDVVASDIADGYLGQVAESAKSQSVSLKVVKCDIEKDISQLGGIKFDYVYFMDVIEHLRTPIVGLENLRHLLSDRGIVFIHTPNACSVRRIYEYLRLRKRVKNYLDPRSVEDLHLQLYDLFTLAKLCNFAGLEVVRSVPTRVTLPLFGRFDFLARRFPAIGDTLLLECKKCSPIDVKKVIDHWVSPTNSGGIPRNEV